MIIRSQKRDRICEGSPNSEIWKFWKSERRVSFVDFGRPEVGVLKPWRYLDEEALRVRKCAAPVLLLLSWRLTSVRNAGFWKRNAAMKISSSCEKIRSVHSKMFRSYSRGNKSISSNVEDLGWTRRQQKSPRSITNGDFLMVHFSGSFRGSFSAVSTPMFASIATFLRVWWTVELYMINLTSFQRYFIFQDVCSEKLRRFWQNSEQVSLISRERVRFFKFRPWHCFTMCCNFLLSFFYAKITIDHCRSHRSRSLP